MKTNLVGRLSKFCFYEVRKSMTPYGISVKLKISNCRNKSSYLEEFQWKFWKNCNLLYDKVKSKQKSKT